MVDLLKVYDTLNGTLNAFSAWKTRNKGNSRAIIEELKNNARYLWLVRNGDMELDDMIAELSTVEYDRLCKEGFNFNHLNKKKISKYKSLESTNLKSWQGKATESLVSNIYDKIKDIKTIYPRAKMNKKYRWEVRVKNVQHRILLLLKHATKK